MSMRTPLLALAGVVFAFSSSASAFPQFETKVPNGRSFGCLTCHKSSGGGEGWNVFGQEILTQGGANPDANPGNQNLGFSGEPHWLDLCDLDSDGDGSTNGEELGDPTCVWAIGDADPSATVSKPGDPASLPADPGEPPPDNGRTPLPPAPTGDAGGCSSTTAATVSPIALVGLAFFVARRRRR